MSGGLHAERGGRVESWGTNKASGGISAEGDESDGAADSIGESQAKSRATKGDPISEEDEGVWSIVLFPTVVGETKDGCRVG